MTGSSVQYAQRAGGVSIALATLGVVEFRDAGRKQLKGIGRQRVYEVVW